MTFSFSLKSVPLVADGNFMSLKEKINQRIDSLAENKQQVVLDFIETLFQENPKAGAQKENRDWNQFSLAQAIEGISEEPEVEYTLADLKERWQ